MEKFNVGYSTIYQRIKKLKEQKILTREGGLYGGRWKIDENLCEKINLSTK